MPTPAPTTRPPTRLRSVGIWLTLLAALYLLINVIRAVVDPVAFAEFYGVPLAATGDGTWVLVYASRTLFVAAVASYVALRGSLRDAAVLVALATVMPIFDATLTAGAGAAAGTVLRHIAVVAVLLVTAGLLERQHRRAPLTGSGGRASTPGRGRSAG